MLLGIRLLPIIASLTAIIILKQSILAVVHGGSYDPNRISYCGYGKLINANQKKEHNYYIKCRNRYRPKYTTKQSAMITKNAAKENNRISKSTTYIIRPECYKYKDTRSCETYLLLFNNSQFESGKFEWIIWYEQSPKRVKTYIAKFPKNSSGSQKSYSIFSYNGFWILDFQKMEFFVLKLVDNLNPYPDTTTLAMFINQDIDHPLFYDEYDSTREGIGRSLYFKDNVVYAINIDRRTPVKLLYVRSVTDGKFIDISNITAAEVENGELIQ